MFNLIKKSSREANQAPNLAGGGRPKRKITQKAFTLIELLVVIAIIGILSSVVMTSLGKARKKAKRAKYVSQMKAFQTAVEQYANLGDTGLYPMQTKIGSSSHSWADEVSSGTNKAILEVTDIFEMSDGNMASMALKAMKNNVSKIKKVV
ncbi:MAG: hypothetical protein DSZ15_03590 [Candidatus Thioglobus sp.]|nr:MAG: hypothetical protein DSZ15_03590 [Candidatus Thioglobus sp.]